MRTSSTTAAPSIPTKALLPFFAIAFGLSWGLASLLFGFPETITRIFGPVGYTNPLFILAVYAPAIAGIALVIRYAGLRSLGSFFKRLTYARMSTPWWVFLVVGIPATFYAGAAIKGTIGDPFPFSPWTGVFAALATALVIGPIEEFGWRGLALPLLQRKYTPFVATLVLGAIWAVWHLPAFFIGGTPQSGWDFGAFFLGVMAIAFILTAMFNAGRGSLLVAFLYHFMMNNPIWPDAQPWDSVLFALVAVVVVIANRKMFFSRGAGSTEVLAEEAPGDLAGVQAGVGQPGFAG